MRDLQLAVVEDGTATRVVKGKVPNARGKTGTTSSNTRTLWFDGYSDGLECICWVANTHGVGKNAVELPMSSKTFERNYRNFDLGACHAVRHTSATQCPSQTETSRRPTPSPLPRSRT